ncbi:MAG: ABC transporter ATP-binding protein [Acidimicrobiia bacterium]|nr:ABC transporter ATP-binding protein [Acidimicrobiia bacterium]
MEPAVEVVDLVKDFGTRRVIDRISFRVPRGQVCALLGPNGAGKTTTIHMLLGLTLPTSGSIRIMGRDVVADRSGALLHTNFTASYVQLPWRLRVRELLRIFCELYEVPDPTAAIEEVAELLGLGDFLDRPGMSLSTGQQTVVLLAKALVNRPRVLFLDEPTASLDPERAVVVRSLLRRVADERGMTVLVTSHNMVEVERLADRILFIAGGRVVADATAQELRARFGAADLEEVYLKVAGGHTGLAEDPDLLEGAGP